jgi:hypothetical protein
MDYTYYNMSEDEFTEKMNAVKQILLGELYKDGYIANEKLLEELAQYYAVTTVTKKNLGSMVAKLFGLDGDKATSGQIVVLRTSSNKPTVDVSCCDKPPFDCECNHE